MAVPRERASTYEAALAVSLGQFIAAQLGHDVAVDGLRRLAGGTAHETWAFDVDNLEGQRPGRLVLRRNFERGMLDGDLLAEFELLSGLDRLGVAVPRTWWCVVEDSPLGQPFMIVDRVAGTDIRKHLAAYPDTDRRRLGRELVRLQARLHQLDWQAELPRLEANARDPGGELHAWTQLIHDSGLEPGPLLTAAAAWLEDHLPATQPSALVHGDFKTNNLLFGVDGTISVLDWELAHIGDPVEDIAWTMLWTTRFDLVGGLLSAEEYQAAYETETGTALDAEVLLFWRLFALLKLAAIFLTGVARGGSHTRPTLQLMGRGLYHIEAELGELLQDTIHHAQGSDQRGTPATAAHCAPTSPAFDGLTTLVAVSRFLTAEVLPAVPRELAGEIRAAVKLLETAGTELNDRQRSLTAETRDLIGHCADIARVLDLADAASRCAQLSSGTEDADGTLTVLERIWNEARSLTTSLIVALQQRDLDPDLAHTVREAHRELLARVYGCLAGYARSRLTWQSVFPTTPTTSTAPTTTAPTTR